MVERLLPKRQLMICLVCVLVLVRYRTMIPAMFAVLLVHQLSRHVVFHFLPFARTGTPPGPAMNLALLAVMIVGLVLSLRSGDNALAAPRRETVDAESERPKAI